ncbi:MAG: acyl-ACP--UDP-N-acetylglucosamine O-acyltransferase [bacterium]
MNRKITMSIHPTAVVDQGAELGRDVTVGPFAVIEKNTCIGDGVVIGPHTVICRHTTIGAGSRIHACAVIGDLPQDLAFKDAVSYTRIGAGCTLREGVTIHRGTKPETATEVGDNCFLMANAHLAHNVKVGNGVIIANGVLCAGYVEIGDRVFVSGNCAIHQFIRIGRLAMLGGLSAISQDLPPFFTTRPASLNSVAACNIVGMRRAGMDSEARSQVRKTFTLLYRSGLNVRQALQQIRAEFASGPALEICDFIEKSKRGICSHSRTGDEPAGE